MLRRCRGRLLSTDIDTLLAAVEQENYNRAVAEAEADAAAGAQGLFWGQARLGKCWGPGLGLPEWREDARDMCGLSGGEAARRV